MIATTLLSTALLATSFAEPKTASEYIALHQAGLDRIDSLDVQLSAVMKNRDGSEIPISTMRWRRARLREHYVEVTHAAYGGGEFHVLDSPSRREYGYDAESVRTLENWDPENQPALPSLPGGTDSNVFASVKASILPRDPAGGYRAAPFWLQLSVTTTHTLSELVAVSEVKSPDVEANGLIKLSMSTKGSGPVVCFLDPEHDYLVGRTEFYDSEGGSPLTTVRVRKFESYGEPAAFFPVQTVIEQQGGSTLELQVTDIRINERLAESDVTLDFPEGVRVDEPAKNLIHVWGDGAPLHSFRSLDEFTRWELATAHGRQRDGQPSQARDASGSWNWLVIANIAIIAVIVLLLWVRRRLSKTEPRQD